MPREESRRRLARIGSTLGLVVGVAGVAFVARTVVSRSDEVAKAWSALEPPALALAVALGAAAMWWIGRTWGQLLALRGHRMPARRALAWYFTGQLGKYIPGGIWPVVGRSEMAARGGVDRPVAYAATTLSMATTYASAALVGGVASILSWTYPAVGGIVLAITVAAILTSGSSRLAAVAGRVISSVGAVPGPGALGRLVVVHVPAWIMIALSTSVTATAFGADVGVTHMMCAASLSWLAGFVVVGVPGGLGVREAAFTALLSPSVPAGVAVSVALASRVVFIVVDVGAALVSGLVAGRSGVRHGSAEA